MSEENHETISVRTVGVPAEIRTERLSNVYLECYRSVTFSFIIIILLSLFGLWGYWHCSHSRAIVPASGDSEDDREEADGM
jgi:hypothetical protein